MKPWQFITIGLLLGLIFAGLLIFVVLTPRGQAIILEQKETPNLMAHISGAIKTPGVYELSLNSRVRDLVDAAGGFIDEADRDKVNLAKIIRDGEKVYIPLIGEDLKTLNEVLPDENATVTNSLLVNINTATQEDLENLPGIGKSKAEAIISYREENGWFLTIEDIMSVPGIGPGIFEDLANFITIDN